MTSPIINGTWTHLKGDRYRVIGKDRSGKPFKQEYDNWFWANGINVWQGSKWLIRKGKKYLIQTITN